MLAIEPMLPSTSNGTPSGHQRGRVPGRVMSALGKLRTISARAHGVVVQYEPSRQKNTFRDHGVGVMGVTVRRWCVTQST